jgi:excisionase family DNA binding protein
MTQSENLDTPPIAYSIEQAAKLINCGRTSIYAFIKSRDLQARKIGRRTIILDDDLRRWLASLPARQAT